MSDIEDKSIGPGSSLRKFSIRPCIDISGILLPYKLEAFGRRTLRSRNCWTRYDRIDDLQEIGPVLGKRGDCVASIEEPEGDVLA